MGSWKLDVTGTPFAGANPVIEPCSHARKKRGGGVSGSVSY